MPLAPGARLGPYEVLALIGAGGMGEVYKARDTKLARDVALKILPDLFAGDPDRLARFEREAKTLASLNHPHIAQIYGIGEGDGSSSPDRGSSRPPYLVMEFVDGPTLADRIARGPLPLDDALPIVRQIAEALEYAHEHGMVHRDLKPANIKVTSDGTVKVLDFGLAKALDPTSGSGASASEQDPGLSPTITSPAMTRMGVILGTAAYMSPEQARGATVDKRADIWAFGCVVYELLTGRRAFDGASVTDTLAAVVLRDPDWGALPATTPARVRELLRRCLTKDRKQRLHDIADARLELEEMKGAETVKAEKPRGSRREIFAWAVAALALAVAVVAITQRTRTLAPVQARPLRVSIIHTEGNEVWAPAISPDGRRVAYRARRADGMPLIWVRDLATGDARPLAGTEGGSMPFWSPDSHDLGFAANLFLKRIPADGGPVQIIATWGWGGGGSWAPDGTIVFSRGDRNLFRVSATGGETKPVTHLQGADWSHYWPSFLPDGRRFLFTAKLWTRAAEASEQGIYLGSVDSPEIRRLLPDLSSAVYAPPGSLVFARDGNLTAVPFDLATGRVTGEASPIGGRVAVDSSYYFSAISAAADGTLAVRPPPASALVPTSEASTTELHLVDRSGRTISAVAPELFSSTMALAPDGHRVAAAIADLRAGTQDLWLIDLRGGTRTPIVTPRGYSGAPVWSPDGAQLAFTYQPPGQVDDVYVKDFRTGQVTPIIQSPTGWEHPAAWSHDGRYLLVAAIPNLSTPLESELLAWSFASRTLTRLAARVRMWAVFSPDERYVAFTASESGRFETYVTTFPERRQTWPLTTEGGTPVSWRADGREILVATLSGHIAAYPVTTTDGGFSAGQPTILVRDVGAAAPSSSATPDHSRILIRVSPDAAMDKGEIRLLFGWQEALKGRAR